MAAREFLRAAAAFLLIALASSQGALLLITLLDGRPIDLSWAGLAKLCAAGAYPVALFAAFPLFGCLRAMRLGIFGHMVASTVVGVSLFAAIGHIVATKLPLVLLAVPS